MQAQSARPVRTFSVGFHHEEYDETRSAAAIAHHLGTEHTELYVSADEARTVIPELAEVYDEPFADSSQIPTLLLARLVRQFVTVGLSGDGGDETFAGYAHYQWAQSVWAAMAPVPRALRRPAGTLLAGVPGTWWDGIYPLAALALPAGMRWRPPGFANRIRQVAACFRTAESNDAVYWRKMTRWSNPDRINPGGGAGTMPLELAALDVELDDFRERMAMYDTLSYLPDDILVKVDRASMAASLELRSPLLDHRVVEWAWSLPFDMKVRGGTRKWILRQLLSRYVPPALFERPKRGFSVPLNQWLRGPLSDWAEDMMRPDRLEDAGLRPGPILDAWRRNRAGGGNSTRLWVVLMLIAWHERWAS